MAQVKPLRLKVQKSTPKPQLATRAPIAQILVDTPAFHLDGTYDYLVSVQDEVQANIGARVKVNFSGKETQGFIISRRDFHSKNDSLAKLKFIEEVISPLPVLSPQIFTLLQQVSERYASSVNELMPAALPDRVAAAEKSFFQSEENPATSESPKVIQGPKIFSPANREILQSSNKLRLSINLSQGINASAAVTEILLLRKDHGQVLIIVPDHKDIELLKLEMERLGLPTATILGTHQNKSERYKQFLVANISQPKIIIGTRSATFTNLSPNSTLIILDDLDESMYEKRSPGWNVRDVALLRAGEASLIFVSHFPSLEISRLVALDWMTEIVPTRNKRLKVTGQGGHRTYFQVLHDGLRKGSVLITTSSPGYVHGFLCQNCRNAAICSCGGRLLLTSENSAPECSICSKPYVKWECAWCRQSQMRMVGRGAIRIAQEMGKAFPGIQVISSTSHRRVDQKPDGKVMVISTLGCEPEGRYSAAVLLDGESIFNRVDLRSEEQAIAKWVRSTSLVEDSGEIFLSLESGHPVLQAYLFGNIKHLTGNLLSQREQVRLPPFFRIATICGSPSDISKVRQIIESSQPFEILGPMSVTAEESKIVLRSPVASGQDLADFLLDFRRLRSIKNLPSLSVRMDPYTI